MLTRRLAEVPPERHAYMVGTYAVSCKPVRESCNQIFNSLSVHYEDRNDETASGRLNLTSGSIFGQDTVPDFVDQEKQERGFHFCIALPPGQYAFHTLHFYNFAGGGSGFSLRRENQFELPFDLSAGEVVYVGKLKLNTSTGKNLFGLKMPAPGKLQVSSNPDQGWEPSILKCPEAARSRTVRIAPLKLSSENRVVEIAADEPSSPASR